MPPKGHYGKDIEVECMHKLRELKMHSSVFSIIGNDRQAVINWLVKGISNGTQKSLRSTTSHLDFRPWILEFLKQ